MSAEAGSSLLSGIASRYAGTGLRLAMLRGDGSRPDLGSGDVDLLVHPADMADAVELLLEAAAATGWRRLFEERTGNHRQVVLWWPDSSAGPPPFAHFDFQDALGRRGLRYARAEPFLAATAPGDWLPRLQPVPRALALALHALLDKAQVREGYRGVLEAAEGRALEQFASGVLPKRAARDVATWVREGARETRLAAVARDVRRELRCADPASLVRSSALRLRRWSRFVGPRRGALVAFVGPDGAGKSTVVEAVAASFPHGPYPVRPVYFGKRETFLPTSRLIRKLYAHRQDARSVRAPSESAPPPSLAARLSDVLGLLNWLAEQWARYAFHARPILQQGGVVLADRYGFDVAQRPGWSLAHAGWFRRLVPRAFPRPDRTYLLWEQPAVLHRRKPELGVEEARLLLERLRAVVAVVPGSRELRTDRPLANTVSEITRDVCALLERSRR